MIGRPSRRRECEMDDGRVPTSRWSNGIARRPAVPAATAFIGGIIVHRVATHWPVAWIVCAILAALIALTLFQRPKISSLAIAAAIFFAAICAAQRAAFQFSRDDISAYAGDEQHIAKLELLIDRPLRIVGTNFLAAPRPMPPKQVTTAKVVRVLTTSGWRDATGQTIVTFDPPNEKLATGQIIRVCGMLQRPPPAMNPGAFDWAEYYREQRILTQLQVPHADVGITILSNDRPTIIAAAREAVRKLLGAGFREEQSLDHALLRALVLGDSDPELRDVQEQFRRTGTSHHLAISGMHVAVLGIFVYGICKLLRLRPRLAAMIGMSFVIFYGVVALPSPSVIRSVVLCAALALGVAMGKSRDNFQLLAISVLGMLVYHPLDLYNAGFQLSFGTVLGLMIFNHRLRCFFGAEPTADEQAAMHIKRPERRVWLRFHARRCTLNILTPSIVAWAVSMPLIAYHFQQLNPWAVVCSIALAPVVFVALLGGFLKIILTAFLPMFATTWAAFFAIPVGWMRHMVDWLAMLPGSDLPLPANSLLFIVIYYALLLIPLIPFSRLRLRQTCRLAPGLAVLMIVMIPLTGGAAAPPDGTLRVTLLAVGAGQCCVMEMPDGRVIVVDAGSSSLTDPVRRCIGPFLRARGLAHVDEIWLSHGDYDHMSAAAELIRTYNVPRLALSTEFDDHAAENPSNEALLNTVRDRRVVMEQFHRDERRAAAKDVTLDVLWPPENSPRLDSNNTGLVLKLTYARRTILFPADIQQPALSALVKTPDALHCDVLVAPHHGSVETSTAAFVKAADPLYIVSSNDRTLSQKQRQFDRLVAGRSHFRTSRCGAVTIEIDRNGGVIVTPFVPPKP
jgi:competence protein ComEC